MAFNQTNKLVWIVETIYKAGKISFEDINNKWLESDMSGGVGMVKRTFHKWRDNILDTFGLVIECEQKAPYRYYIMNADEIKRNTLVCWLLNTYSVCNSLLESRAVKDRILLENVPSSSQLLDSIVGAMKESRYIHFNYTSYWNGTMRDHYVMPLCIKLFRQRWYMVGRSWPAGMDVVYSLDRMNGFRLSSHKFDYPKNFNPQEFFEGCFGVIVDKECDVQEVLIKTTPEQANYMRDVPLMSDGSQEETERNDEYSVFRLRVRPTYDFMQELLWCGGHVEVLEPECVRTELAKMIGRMNTIYYDNSKRI